MKIFKKQREEGQGLVEYALILVLVSVVVIGVLTILGPQVAGAYQQVASVLGGGDDNTDEFCQIYTIEGYDTWNTNSEPFPGTYSAPWTSVSQDQATNPGHPSCSAYGAWLP